MESTPKKEGEKKMTGMEIEALRSPEGYHTAAWCRAKIKDVSHFDDDGTFKSMYIHSMKSEIADPIRSALTLWVDSDEKQRLVDFIHETLAFKNKMNWKDHIDDYIQVVWTHLYRYTPEELEDIATKMRKEFF